MKHTKTIREQFKACRDNGVSLVAIETADPAATIINTVKALNGEADTTPIMQWDCCRGMTPLNAAGQSAMPSGLTPNDPLDAVLNQTMQHAPEDTLFYIHNAHRFLNADTVTQAVWNIRDEWKSKGCTLVLLGTIIRVPIELKDDLVKLKEPLPTRDELKAIVENVAEGAKVKQIGDVDKIVNTITGTSAFGAEQNTSMALVTEDGKKRIDHPTLWDRKCMMVEATEGLSVWRGEGGYGLVGGLRNAVRLFDETMKGKAKPTGLVFSDEIDKAMAAVGTDTSGVTQDAHKCMLTYMEERKALGIFLYGCSGTGKTQLMKAVSSQFDVPLIQADWGGMKGKHVGDSEGMVRSAINIIDAVTEGRALWVCAGNKSDKLPTELRRRYNYYSMFFDLPDGTEREPMWQIHSKAFGLTKAQSDRTKLNDEGWTGAEIYNCCRAAWSRDITLVEAAKDIIPVNVSDGETVNFLRRSASGKYISASKPGTYIYDEGNFKLAATGRKFSN